MAETEVKLINGRTLADVTARNTIEEMSKPTFFVSMSFTLGRLNDDGSSTVASVEDAVDAYLAGHAYVLVDNKTVSTLHGFVISTGNSYGHVLVRYPSAYSVAASDSYLAISGSTQDQLTSALTKYLPASAMEIFNED